jgi:hypothetical protein
MSIAIPELFNVSKRMFKAEMKVIRVEQGVEGDGKSGFSAIGKGFALGDVSKQLSDLITESAERLGTKKLAARNG